MLRTIFPVLLIAILVGCSNQASVISAKNNMVIIRAKPVIFLDALFLAEQECQKEERPVRYVENYSTDLSVVAFECIVEEESEIEEVTGTDSEEDVSTTTEVDDAIEETDVETSDAEDAGSETN